MSSKTLCRVRNWRAYNQALVDRGNITVWFAPEAIKGWQSERRHNGRGRPEEFSDAAIEYCSPRSGACKSRNPSPGMAMRSHNVEACWAIGRDAWKKGTP